VSKRDQKQTDTPPDFTFPLVEDPADLARYQGWDEAAYRDLIAVERGSLSKADFDQKYLATKAILVLDITGFTLTTLHGGAISSFLRILDMQKVCLPILREHGSTFIRFFADDIVGLFDDCGAAVDVALEIHRRTRAFNDAFQTHESPPQCCIGIGYGAVYEIGPNWSMGDEMNQASVLGEDVARGGETLVTEGVQRAIADRSDVCCEPQASDDLPFPYFRLTEKD